MSMQNVRRIEARVDIYYGNEETSEISAISAPKMGRASNLDDLYGAVNDLGYKAFTLEESFTLGERRRLVGKFGWWGTVSSSETAAEKNVYPFPSGQIPSLQMEFAAPRIIRKIDIFGDKQLDEYPSRFELALFDTNGKEVYKGVFANKNVHSQAVLKENGAYLADEDGNMIKVRRLELRLLAWNKPHRVSKIYRFYDDIKEVYKNDDVKEFEVVHEKVNNGAIKYGLCSDSCNVTIYNKDRKFDRGYLKNMIHLNKMIVPHINKKRLGNFYIKEWSFSNDGMFVKCSANDRLMDFQSIIYPGRMPYRKDEDINALERDEYGNQILQQISFYEMFEEVLEFALNSPNVRKFDYKISPVLSDYAFTPFVREATVWAVLQKLCDATLSHVYIDENDVLIVETALKAKTPRLTVKTRTAAIITSEQRETEAAESPLPTEGNDGEDGPIEINGSNAFSMDVPYFADMVANEVEIGYFTKNAADNIETLYEKSEITVGAGETYTETFVVDEIYDEINITYTDIRNLCQVKLVYDKYRSFILQIKSPADTVVTIKNIVVQGQKIDFVKTQLPKSSTATDSLSTRYPYTHPDSEFIQSAEYAELLRNRIMECYPEDTKSSSVQWRGDLKLGVSKKFELENRFKEKELYSCTYSKITVQGGMRQETKGVLIKDNL